MPYKKGEVPLFLFYLFYDTLLNRPAVQRQQKQLIKSLQQADMYLKKLV